jgi:dihydropteroate synthase
MTSPQPKPEHCRTAPCPTTLACGRHRLALDRPRVMGVLNVTPDSFSDGGQFLTLAHAVERACAMREAGADVIDIGGESTRPGAHPVSEREELDRVMPVLEALVRERSLRDVVLSVDTRKPAVMRAAIGAGATMINDVQALRAPGALEAIAASAAGVCLMLMQGEPSTMQEGPAYANVEREVRDYLEGRTRACLDAGIARERIVVDPGFGFGKNRAQNVALLRNLGVLRDLGFPILCGLSRKNVIATLPGRAPGERIAASVAAALAAVARGASLVRVHDVRETCDALSVWTAVMECGLDAG